MDFSNIDRILDKYDRSPSGIIRILQDVQAELNYLPRDVLKYIASSLSVPLSHVYRIATFYNAFSLVPKGKHMISVCLGTACHVRGAPKVLEKIERELGISPGETTEDLEFSLETVNCLGACALGPIVVVDGEYNGEMNVSKVDELLKKIKQGGEINE
ncbi:MAG: NAD(P)H-dependent oxidoreductase subunit E [Deltaproteobacteria bacterium]|nr:NAD(P)H-dependent oxidoreductase subunit E [Deltaproteobacteria bacterium]RLA89485.1 MAG: NAD(P)H-dependent oxidoreductase subunit E [Deltaproteobacteria bacterium]